MNKAGHHILRVGMAITFLWIGLLIFKEPSFWSGFLPPFLFKLVPDPSAFTLLIGVVDIIVGLLLLVGWFTFWISLVAAVHLLFILIFSGIDAVTVRDIGLLAGALALAAQTVPRAWRRKKAHS